MTNPENIIKTASKVLFCLGLVAFLFHNTAGAAMLLLATGLYIYRPY